MKKIVINHIDERGETTYYVYSKEEADSKDIEYKYWKDADTNDWAISDDDYVAQVIKRKSYTDHRGKISHYLRFPFGFMMWKTQYPSTKFKFEGRLNNGTLSGKSPTEVSMGNEKIQNLALCFAHVYDRDLAIQLAIGDISPATVRKYRRIMKTERFKKVVNEKIQALLAENDLTEQFTLSLLKEVIDMAKTKSDITNLMRAIENLQDMHGMKGNRVKKSIAVEESHRRKLIDSIHEEKRKIEASQEQDG